MIGGNIEVDIQVKKEQTVNEIGERVTEWETVQTLTGWLDLMSGDSSRVNYNSKIQESTHVFICDYEPLNDGITAENSRLIVNNERYDITLIDNPMELNQQWEIFLKYTGGQD